MVLWTYTMQLIRFVILAIALARAAPLAAAGWGLGAAYQQGVPVLSMQVKPAPDEGWHGTAHYSATAIAATLDWQHFWYPSFARSSGVRGGFYAGSGLAGASTRETAAQESFHLRLPLGAEVALTDLHITTFVEASGELGPIPETTVAAAFTGGLRATF